VSLLDEITVVAVPLEIVLWDRQLTAADADAIALEDESGGSYWIKHLIWLTLFEAARVSIDHRAAIQFG
jgi:hypothetical protein